MRPRIAFEAGDPNVLVQLARRGLGVAVLPRVVATAAGSGLVALALGPPELRARMEVLWRADGSSSPAAQALIALAREAVGDPPAPRGQRPPATRRA